MTLRFAKEILIVSAITSFPLHGNAQSRSCSELFGTRDIQSALPPFPIVGAATTSFGPDPDRHPDEPERQKNERENEFQNRHKAWVANVLAWMEDQNDPNGVMK